MRRLRTLVLASGGSHLQVVPLPTQERVLWLSTPWEMEGSLREESEEWNRDPGVLPGTPSR